MDIIESILDNSGLAGATSFHLGNILKYLIRAEHKNDLEDYIKAKDYLNRLIEKKIKNREKLNLKK